MKQAFWYHKKDDRTEGPFSFKELKVRIIKGFVHPNDLVFSDVLGKWRPAHRCHELDQSLFPAEWAAKEELILLDPSAADPGPAPTEEVPLYLRRWEEQKNKQLRFAENKKTAYRAYWYFYLDNKLKGPFSYEEVCNFIEAGQLKPRHMLYNDLLATWNTVISYKVFSPKIFPQFSLFSHCSNLSDFEQVWVVLCPDGKSDRWVTEGPYSSIEIAEKIRCRALGLEQMAWRPGMSQWCPLGDIPIL